MSSKNNDLSKFVCPKRGLSHPHFSQALQVLTVLIVVLGVVIYIAM